jgi:hypothetical protein
MTLLNRIVAEKRSVVVPLAIAAAVNIGAYALVVRPLEQKSAGAANRAAAAAASAQAADQEYADARALVTGKVQAEQELATFYSKVVPVSLPAARLMTATALPALAQKTNVKYEQGRFERDATSRNTRLGHLQIRLVLQGEYEAVRRFIYELETAPQFVIIDEWALTQSEVGRPVTLQLVLSTYYRLGANGT